MESIVEVDGIKVISQGIAYGRHPSPEYTKQVPISNVTHVLLADESERFVCEVCYTPFDKVQSAIGHLRAHSEPNTNANTSSKTIKAVLRAVRRHQFSRSRYQSAADELNAAGVVTFFGNQWTIHSVGNIWRRYRYAYRSYIRSIEALPRNTNKNASPSAEDFTNSIAEPININTTDDDDDVCPTQLDFEWIRATAKDIREALSRAQVVLGDITSAMNNAAEVLDHALAHIVRLQAEADMSPKVDQDILIKAEMYDRMRDMMK